MVAAEFSFGSPERAGSEELEKADIDPVASGASNRAVGGERPGRQAGLSAASVRGVKPGCELRRSGGR
jgi:hypothetical protein